MVSPTYAHSRVECCVLTRCDSSPAPVCCENNDFRECPLDHTKLGSILTTVLRGPHCYWMCAYQHWALSRMNGGEFFGMFWWIAVESDWILITEVYRDLAIYLPYRMSFARYLLNSQ